MLGADTAAAARFNLGPVGDIPPNLIYILVIYVFYMLDAE
jgi:hypothetical protein